MPELVMSSYCGMRIPIMKGTNAECQARAKRICDQHGGPITLLDYSVWELETPDDAGSIGDMDGILRVVPDKEDEDAISEPD